MGTSMFVADYPGLGRKVEDVPILAKNEKIIDPKNQRHQPLRKRGT